MEICELLSWPKKMCTDVLYSLTTKLPFEDDEFDHIHLKGIARAVPETKVSNMFIICIPELNIIAVGLSL